MAIKKLLSILILKTDAISRFIVNYVNWPETKRVENVAELTEIFNKNFSPYSKTSLTLIQ